MTVTKAQIFEAAKAKIDFGWTQGADSRDANGKAQRELVFTNSVCYCSSGAVYAACQELKVGDETSNVTKFFYEAFFVETGSKSVVVWNDDPIRTKEEVLDVFGKIIVKAKELES